MKEITFEGTTPPTSARIYTEDVLIMYVPAGSGAAYYEAFKTNYLVVLENGSNIYHVETMNDMRNTIFDIYDKNEVGIMEPIKYGKVWREPDGRMLAISKENKISLYEIDGEQASAILSTSLALYNAETIINDIDNDGRTDFGIYESPGSYTADGRYWDGPVIYTQQADGSFIETSPQITQEEETKEQESQTWHSFLQGFLRNGMFVGGTDGAISTDEALTFLHSVDMNNDGILDITTIDGLYFSQPDGSIILKRNREKVFPYDIDGDGEVDYVCYDGAKLYVVTNITGGEKTRRDLYSNSKIDLIEFRDFDHDGDIDILAFLNTSQYGSNGDSYFVFFRNNGNGTFRRKEQNFGDTWYNIMECRDYDADGCYELLVKKKVSYNNYDFQLMKVNPDFSLSLVDDTFSLPYSVFQRVNQVVLGDFNNDGRTEFYSFTPPSSPYSTIWSAYGHLNTQTMHNTAPAKMATPTAMFMPEANRLKIAWQQGADAETSACDLTYELRIGTQPGLSDVLRAESMSDGKRLTIREGNQGTMRQTLFNVAALKPGKYYISVQAIDQGGLGGAFSDEFVYEHALQAPVFYVSTENLSTADTLQVYVKSVVPEASYEWSATEGEIIDQTELGAKIVFHRQGYHEIGLSMNAEGTTYQATPKTVYVAAMKVSEILKSDIISVDSYYLMQTLFDWNQDGNLDFMATRQVYKNNGDGSFEKVLLSTFADWDNGSGVSAVLDFNLDGYPDMVVKNNRKGNIFLNYGEQDFDFDYQTVDFGYSLMTYHRNSYPLGDRGKGNPMDLNNDGLMDVVTENGETYVTEDGVEFLRIEEKTSEVFHYDVNRDGFPDLVWYELNKDDRKHQWYCQLKDSTQAFIYGEPQLLFCTDVKNDYLGFEDFFLADFNNDGYVDLVYTAREREGQNTGMYVIKGEANGCGSEVVVTIEDVGVYSIPFDLNNDGYLDLYTTNKPRNISSSDTWKEQIITFKPDFAYELQPYSNEPHPVSNQSMFILPFTGNGEIICNGTVQKTNILNQSPSAPTQVAVKQTQEGMLITWDDAQDDHTPAAQMRYNISVKRKGKNGEGAFVISPINGLKDEAAIVPGYSYKQSTQMLVPSTVLTTGETYEIQVQAIDLWSAHSPMSSPVEFTMGNNGYIEAEDRIAVGKETLIALHAAQAAYYSIDPGEGGKVVKDYGNGQYSIKWTTPGVKTYTITAGTTAVSSQITVVNRIDVSFTLPDFVLAGTPIAINVSEEMASMSTGVGFECVGATVDYTPGAKTAFVTFPSPDSYLLTAFCKDAVRGNQFTRNVIVNNSMPKAEITRVDIEDNSRYAISWSQLPSYINKIIIEKECANIDEFLPIDTVDVAKCTYTRLVFECHGEVVPLSPTSHCCQRSGECSKCVPHPYACNVNLFAHGGLQPDMECIRRSCCQDIHHLARH